jgi:hypothetical protein
MTQPYRKPVCERRQPSAIVLLASIDREFTMPQKLVARLTTGAVSLALLLAPLPALADQTIHCRSGGFNYRYCPIETHGRVELVRQTSFIECREGRNWGHDRNGVWVDNGCAGDFRVGRDSSGGKAVAALIGLAAIAAIASSKSKQDSQEVASWAVGNFSGYDRVERVQVELNILPGGSLTGRAGTNAFSGNLQGDSLQAGRQRFRIAPQGNGFVATSDNNPGNQIVFQRTGSGY